MAAPTPGNWHRCFADLTDEHGFADLEVEGRLPADLRGTVYRNSAARFHHPGGRFGHWFDGDGAVSAVRFADGGAQGAVRLVQTEARAQEARTGKLSNGGFRTPTPSVLRQLYRVLRGRTVSRNPANTSVVCMGGRLFALCEGGLPVEVDAADLRTLGETDLDGVVPMMFSAHPRRVPQRRSFYNFGVRYGRDATLDVFALPDDGPARRLVSLPIGATLIHDFVATPDHLIFFAPPLRADMPRLLFGLSTYVDSLRWQPALGTEVIVVPLADPERPLRFFTEPFFQWHFANAYERAGTIVIDLVRHAAFPDTERWLEGIYAGGAGADHAGQLARAEVDLARRRVQVSELPVQACEFPQVAPPCWAAPHRYVYVTGHSAAAMRMLPDQVVKLDVDTGRREHAALGPDITLGEPIFVRRADASAEDDGYLLGYTYDARSHRSGAVVLDARDLAPLYQARFGHHLPYPFHGTWMAA